MLKLYNAGASVCSVKVRIGMAEKGLEWEDILFNLPKGEQNDPAYLKLNPNGVVPTLVDEDLVIIESSVILEYVDELVATNPLMPTEKGAKAITKIWLLRCLDIHGAINTMSFSTANRDALLANKTPEELEAYLQKITNPKVAEKRRDLVTNGIESSFVNADFFVLRRMFEDMQAALEKTTWLTGNNFGLSDTALLAYVDRLDRLSMSGLWEERWPLVGKWLEAAKLRPSYAKALDGYISEAEKQKALASGQKHWPQVKQRWDAFLAKG